jgi:hypothetical protein
MWYPCHHVLRPDSIVEGDPGLVRGPQLDLIADHRGDGDENHAERADRPEE